MRLALRSAYPKVTLKVQTQTVRSSVRGKVDADLLRSRGLREPSLPVLPVAFLANLPFLRASNFGGVTRSGHIFDSASLPGPALPSRSVKGVGSLFT